MALVVEPTASREKLIELLAIGTELAELDYKTTLDLNARRDTVEIAKDVAAMNALPSGATSSLAPTTAVSPV